MATVYVLELKPDSNGRKKYYVGKTDNVDKRLDAHKKGEGSAWTKRFPVERLVETRTGASEDDVTIEYMKNYGIYIQ